VDTPKDIDIKLNETPSVTPGPETEPPADHEPLPVPLAETDAESALQPQAELDACRRELADARQRHLLLLADFDNYRKRMSATLSESAQEEKRRFIRELLEVVDNFERAMHFQQAAASDDFFKGIQSIHSQLQTLLRNHQVERLEADGLPFDPKLHEILDAVPNPDRPEHTVTRVYKPGYLHQGKVLRPALVQVSLLS